MSRRIFCKLLLLVVTVLGLLILSNALFAQGRSEDAFERAKAAQEGHTNALLAKPGVVGTAVGLNDDGQYAVLVLLEIPGAGDIPDKLERVPVRPVVTGKIYALAKPTKPERPGRPHKDRTPPDAPEGLNAMAISSNQIDLDWSANSEEDLSYYNVYRSTTSGSGYGRIASKVTTISYSDTGLAPETTYYYVITAVDESRNESSDSNEASATTLSENVEPPIWPRPVHIGVSTGHPNITAGTIGCRVTKGNNYYALSNNHVYADENRASIGDNVLVPGPYDGGQNPRDRIGTLEDYVRINFGPRGRNKVDAAIALLDWVDLDGDGVEDSLAVYNDTPNSGYGTPSSDTTEAFIEQEVQKYGRTTGLTHGVVYGVNATVKVLYDSGQARFVEQILITPGNFSGGGDSGSLIVTDDDSCNPVGLLFAGSSSVTVANPIDEVLTSFGVSVDSD